METILEELNEEQKVPASAVNGAVLVTAGAGSGKTRMLTHRIAYLIKEQNISPYNILAITFTNKAANEMRLRIEKLVDNTQGIWIMTFHSMCVRILRSHIDKMGFDRNFTIYGDGEREQLVKKIINELNLDDEEYRKLCLNHISKAKNANLNPDEYMGENLYASRIETICKVYAEYQRMLQKNNALDFDDLLIKTYELLRDYVEVRNEYQARFNYIHIDEFQDTNQVQYDIARLMCNENQNIFAVGDEDQCIYGWRGANIENIFNFKKDFKNVKVFKLERNYRSTKNILNLANNVIKNNTQRMEKVLWTQNNDGGKIQLFAGADEYQEAEYVVRQISILIKEYGYKANDFAILMRLNALSKPFEDRLVRYGINYKVLGGLKFYERAEIKNVNAYLQVLTNPLDDQSFLRIVNFPRRGIGDASVTELQNYAKKAQMSLCNYILSEKAHDLPSKLFNKLTTFIEMIKELKMVHDLPLLKYVDLVIEKAGIKASFDSTTEEGFNRILNIDAYLSSVQEYEKNNPKSDLPTFLQGITLISDIDTLDGEKDEVLISTIHAVKGLEFKCVFVVGLQDGLFPIVRFGERNGELEEERRLLYVAITRAEERLYLTRANNCFYHGKRNDFKASRFLDEIRGCESLDSKYVPKTPVNNFVQNAKPTVAFGIEQIKKAQNQDYSEFKVGTRVEHPRYGEGVVVNTDNLARHKLININFADFGVKVLAIEITPLTIIK